MSDVLSDGIVEWADLVAVVADTTTEKTSVCPSNRCNGSEISSLVQFQNVDNIGVDHVNDFNNEMRSCKLQETQSLSQLSQSTLLFVDIPNVFDDEHIDITLINLSADNLFNFAAFPDNLYRLVGVVCHAHNHYYAYVLKKGDWFIVDCVKKPHVKQVLTSKLFEKMNDVTLMMFEKI